MKQPYSYAIIKYNYPELERESTLLDNKYRKTKYALIQKVVHKDGSENIATIYYSNDLEKLQEQANGYLSWYSYPISLYKDTQQNIRHLEAKFIQNK